ncbi:MAG: hypothetical protein ABI837_09515 [Acidobacteriota bacterium]
MIAVFKSRVFTLVAALLLISACDKYEPTRKIVGAYTPSRCVTLQGVIAGGVVSHHKTIHPTICQRIAVSELGVYTYGGGWSRSGVQAEVARLEFAGTEVLIETADLEATGTLKYTDPPTHKQVTVMNVYALVGICLLILSALSGIALFWRAVGANDADHNREEGRMTTLWGLFIIGLIAGLILIKIGS